VCSVKCVTCAVQFFAQQDAGYSAGELRGAGFNASKMMVRMGLSKEGLYGVGQLLHAGYSVEELWQAGFQLDLTMGCPNTQ
jgi:hypothetical protein